jgi:hypothetical protein
MRNACPSALAQKAAGPALGPDTWLADSGLSGLWAVRHGGVHGVPGRLSLDEPGEVGPYLLCSRLAHVQVRADNTDRRDAPRSQLGGEHVGGAYLNRVRDGYITGYSRLLGRAHGYLLATLDRGHQQLGRADERHRRPCRDDRSHRTVGGAVGDVGGDRRGDTQAASTGACRWLREWVLKTCATLADALQIAVGSVPAFGCRAARSWSVPELG